MQCNATLHSDENNLEDSWIYLSLVYGCFRFFGISINLWKFFMVLVKDYTSFMNADRSGQ